MNLIDVPGDPAFQGELRSAARVVKGALFTVSAVMRVENDQTYEGPVAARHSPPGRQGSISAVIRSPTSHSADDVDLPPADDADDDVARRECQDTTTDDALHEAFCHGDRGACEPRGCSFQRWWSTRCKDRISIVKEISGNVVL